MFCTNCGAKIADDLKFCTGCGTPLPAASPGPANEPAPVAATPVAAPTRAPVLAETPQPSPADRPKAITRPLVPLTEEPEAAPILSAAHHTSGSKAMTVVVLALLVVGAIGGAYYFFSSRSAETTMATETTASAPAGNTPQAAVIAQVPGRQVDAPLADQPAGVATPDSSAESATSSPTGPTEADAEKLVQAAAAADAVRLEALISELELQPAVPVGNRGEARRIAYRALPLLRAEKYDESIPILEEARRADESDVEVVGNLADTLMRAGRLDEAWGVALEALRLAPRRTAGWSTIGMLSAKRDDAPGAVACLLTAYRFSDAQPKTLEVFSKLATTDDDPKVRAAMEGAITRIRESQ